MGISRQLIFCIDPSDGAINTLSYADIVDGNSGNELFTCGYVPPAKGAGISLAQETMFLGSTAEAGKMFQTFKSSEVTDGGAVISSEFITNRIDPDNRPEAGGGRANTTKRYLSMRFNGVAPIDEGVDVYWAKDIDPTRSPSVSWTAISGESGDTTYEFESGLAEWIHVRGVHDEAGANEIHLDNFSIDYITVGGREGRDS